MRGTGGSLVDYSMRGEGKGEEEERGEGKEGQGAYYHKAAVIHEKITCHEKGLTVTHGECTHIRT